MALTKTARTLVAAGTTVAATIAQYGTINLNAVQGGGFLTIRIANGATGPTSQCVASVFIAHNATLPAAAAPTQGGDWKTIATYGGGTTALAITEIGMPIDPSVMCLQVSFSGNTAQSVIGEAYFSELTSAV